MKIKALIAGLLVISTTTFAQTDNKAHSVELNMTQVWDKTFPQSNNVEHKKITFYNRFGITLAADMYIPKNASGKLPAIAASGP